MVAFSGSEREKHQQQFTVKMIVLKGKIVGDLCRVHTQEDIAVVFNDFLMSLIFKNLLQMLWDAVKPRSKCEEQ